MLHTRKIMASLGLLLVLGCGSGTYEERLKETNALFEYHLGLDRVLQPGDWSSPTTIKMRIPKGFTALPAPPPPKPDEPDEPVPEDPRQPFYLGLTLPGLVGAWQGLFPCDDGQSRPVYMYVCSNHQVYQGLAANPKGADPELFLTNLETDLSNAMQVQLPPGEGTQIGNNVRYSEMCPRDGKYAVQRKFTGITFVPPDVLPQVGVAIKTQMYGHYNGKVQVAILVVYPASVRDRIEDRLLTALETFSVSSSFPSIQPGAPIGPGGVPANRPAGF